MSMQQEERQQGLAAILRNQIVSLFVADVLQ